MTEVLHSIQAISLGIAGFSGTALIFAGALAIAGTLAMAILQIIKELTPMRRWYQRLWFERWLTARAESFTVNATKSTSNEAIRKRLPVKVAEAQQSMVALATGGEANAFYDLQNEQMVAQMNAAAQVALEYPKIYFALLAVLSEGAEINDIARLLARADAGTRKPPDQGFLDARNRVGNRIQRNLDGIQIALGSHWRWWMQFAAIALTVLFIELAIVTNVPEYGWVTLAVGTMLGVVGGYLAPITRDLVAALQNLRKA